MRIVFTSEFAQKEPVYKDMNYIPRIGEKVYLWDSLYVVIDVTYLSSQQHFKQRFDIIVSMGEQRDYRPLLSTREF
jgi:hypothetical protein